MLTFIVIVICLVIVLAIYIANEQSKYVASLSPTAKARYLAKQAADAETSLYGPINREMVCPHCQEKGKVRTRAETRKAGVSGGKATGALLTGGVSLLATGLSRKETGTKAYCGNCKSTWFF